MESLIKPITVDMIYVPVVTARLETQADDSMKWITTDKRAPQTGSCIMGAISQLLLHTQLLHVLDFAKKLGVNERDLGGALRILTGIKHPDDFIEAYRMKQAKEYLACTDLTATEIARRCGFKYQEDLSYSFKKLEKTSPNNYREAHRPKNFREIYRWE